MKITNYIILFISLWFISISLQGQGDQYQSLEVSILTCGQSEDLYSLFGHSALRIRDTLTGTDLVYNWGIFDFGEPNMQGLITFGSRFLSGKLPYAFGYTTYDHFLREYKANGRSVDQQVIEMEGHQKKQLIDALVINLQEENRTYPYDFYFDNCVTRPRDVLEAVIEDVTYADLEEGEKTFRDLLHENLRSTPWTQLGMDLILGTQSDEVADIRDQMFLPEYYRKYLNLATSGEKRLIVAERQLLPQVSTPSETWIKPTTLFWGLLILEIVGAFFFYISGDRGFLRLYDVLWFIALGAASMIMMFMWLATNHSVCENNYNLLWAGPWVLLYWLKGKVRDISIWLTLITSGLVLICWVIIPQALPAMVIPICLISMLKSLRLLGQFRKLDKVIMNATVLVCLVCFATYAQGQKIDGITLVSPPREFTTDPMPPLLEVRADWVAVVPYGFSRHDEPEVYYDTNRQWWGEKLYGTEMSIKYAQDNGLKVMIKPQVWIHGTWVGDVDYDTEEEWQRWETTYRSYIIQFAELAAKYDVEMICVGTEYRQAVLKREQFWRTLIADIRSMYQGKLTYSANWDDYENVPFWDALDYVGISAYFPLSDMDTPPKLLLSYRWGSKVKKLKKYSKKVGKKILFTEYGYLSVDGAAGKTWELEKKVASLDVNQQAQANGYDALLDSFWDEDFWAGGFLWKWFPAEFSRGLEKEYTPQNKKAARVLTKWYGKSGR